MVRTPNKRNNRLVTQDSGVKSSSHNLYLDQGDQVESADQHKQNGHDQNGRHDQQVINQPTRQPIRSDSSWHSNPTQPLEIPVDGSAPQPNAKAIPPVKETDLTEAEADDPIDEAHLTPGQPKSALWSRLWLMTRLSLTLVCTGVAGAFGVAWGTRHYIESHLVPTIEDQLETRLNRTVDLGDITYIGPWQVTLSQSEIDGLIEVQSLTVSADVWQWLQTRELKLDLKLNQPTATLREAADGDWSPLPLDQLKEAGSTEGLPIPLSSVSIKVVNGGLTAIPLVGESRVFNSLQGQARLNLKAATSASQAAEFQLRAELDQHPVRVEGTASLQDPQIALQVDAEQLPLDLLPSVVPKIPLNQLSGVADLVLDLGWQPAQPLQLQLEAQVADAAFEIDRVPNRFSGVNGSVTLDGQTLGLQAATGQFGDLDLTATGQIQLGPDGFYDLKGQTSQVQIADLQNTFNFGLPTEVEGTVDSTFFLTGALNQPVIEGEAYSVNAGRVDQIVVPTYQTAFALQGSTLSFDAIQGTLANGTVEGSGTVQLGSGVTADFQATMTGINSAQVASAYEISLPKTVGQVNGQVQFQWSQELQPIITANLIAQGGEITGTAQLNYSDSILTVPNADLALAGGRVAVSGQLDQGQITGTLTPSNINLAFFNPVLDEKLSGQLKLQAQTEALTLAAIEVNGQVVLPEGVGPVTQPITAEVVWTGSTLQIIDGQIETLASVQGEIPFNPQTSEVGDLNLRLQAQQVPLQSLPQLPEQLQIQGLASLTGQLTGPLNELAFAGDLILDNSQVVGLAFQTLQGPISWSADTGTELALQGPNDQLRIALDPTFQPETFTVKQGSIEATGAKVGDEITLELQSVPLTTIASLLPGATLESLGGTIQGDLTFNWVDQSAQGTALIESLTFADLEADQIEVAFDFKDNQLQIPQANLQLFNSAYELSGDITLPTETREASIHLSVGTTQATLQDVISTFQWQTWDDVRNRGLRLPALGPAAAVVTEPVQGSRLTLLDQLALYEQTVRQLRQEQSQEADQPIPQPPDLQGDLQATVTIAGSLTEPELQFELEGQQWSAQDFQLETVSAAGSLSLADTIASLDKLELSYQDRVGLFSGQVGPQHLAGNLQIEQLPLKQFQRFVPAYLNVEGDLNASINLSGSLSNPAASGQISLLTAQLNQIPIQTSQIDFSYDRGLLNVNSTSTIEDEPITISGTVPYTLPFASIQAPSQQIDLSLDVPSEGLKLMNLVSDQVTWEGGDSQLQLVMRGTVQEPIIQGELSVNQGILQIKALPEPITDIVGRVTFDFNHLEVEQLQGQYGQGHLTAAGVLPINSQGAQTIEDDLPPLTLQLDQLNVDLPQGYNGDINGELLVKGVLLRPILAGQLMLSNGIFDITPKGTPTNTGKESNLTGSESPFTIIDNIPDGVASGSRSIEPARAETSSGFFNLDALRISLGNNVDVTRRQLFNFTTTGNLQIFGTLEEPQLTGTLKLEQGRITLPVAEFRLDRSRRNTIKFDLNRGLDPALDVYLRTQVAEVYPPSQPVAVVDGGTPFVGFQNTIDVMARVRGPASQLITENPRAGIVDIRSTPSRSESEIFALLGGNLVASLGSGAGVASLAGQGLINTIGESLGLDEVRLGPIPQVSTSAPNRASVGLGLEVAKDLGSTISISGQQNLTDGFQPTRYSTRYRLNQETLLRLSTDFEGNSITSIEFDTRF